MWRLVADALDHDSWIQDVQAPPNHAHHHVVSRRATKGPTGRVELPQRGYTSVALDGLRDLHRQHGLSCNVLWLVQRSGCKRTMEDKSTGEMSFLHLASPARSVLDI
jgi:hypothetical protein